MSLLQNHSKSKSDGANKKFLLGKRPFSELQK